MNNDIAVHNNKINTSRDYTSLVKIPSILLVANNTTNFIYRLSCTLTKKQLVEINTFNVIAKILDEIKKQGCSLAFYSIEHQVFGNNLLLIDSSLPQILGHLILLRHFSKNRELSLLTNLLEKNNPLSYDQSLHQRFYEKKVKYFLTAIAVGMIPSKVWDGQYNSAAYHDFSLNEFEDYLFHNTKLDTAGSSKHDFGKIYEENGNFFIKLNLQIRFKK